MRDRGLTRVVRNEDVLILKLVCPEGASVTPLLASVGDMTNVLKSIPVKNCIETNHGCVVVKFPYEEAKN